MVKLTKVVVPTWCTRIPEGTWEIPRGSPKIFQICDIQIYETNHIDTNRGYANFYFSVKGYVSKTRLGTTGLMEELCNWFEIHHQKNCLHFTIFFSVNNKWERCSLVTTTETCQSGERFTNLSTLSFPRNKNTCCLT